VQHRLVWAWLPVYHDVVGQAQNLGFVPRCWTTACSRVRQDEIALTDNSASPGTKLEHNDYTGFELEPSGRLHGTSAGQMLWVAVSRRSARPRALIAIFASRSRPRVLAACPVHSETVTAYELGYRTQPVQNLARRSTSTTLRSRAEPELHPAPSFHCFFRTTWKARRTALNSAQLSTADGWRVHAGYDLLKEHLRIKPGQVTSPRLSETADPSSSFPCVRPWTCPQRRIDAGCGGGHLAHYNGRRWNRASYCDWIPGWLAAHSHTGAFGSRPESLPINT